MTLRGLKQHIEKIPNGTKLNWKLSEPFSWRGDYNEVAFALKNEECTKEYLLQVINQALTESFYGYKGGGYSYNEHTDVNFERDYSTYTDGGYVNQIIESIAEQQYQSEETKLINLVYPIV